MKRIDYAELLSGYNSMVRNSKVQKIGGFQKHPKEFATEKEMFKTLYDEFDSISILGKIFGISDHAIRMRLIKLGIELKVSKKGAKEKMIKSIPPEKLVNMSTTDVSRHVGCSFEYASAVLNKNRLVWKRAERGKYARKERVFSS